MNAGTRAALTAFSLMAVLAAALTACSSATGTPASEPGGGETWLDIEWQWVKTVDRTSDGVVEEAVPDPSAYTIVFRSDGSLQGKADCNAFSGTYSSNGDFTIALGPMTTAYCGEDSLDMRFVELLGTVVAGGPDGGGGFALESAGGAQRLEFRNGGPAPSN